MCALHENAGLRNLSYLPTGECELAVMLEVSVDATLSLEQDHAGNADVCCAQAMFTGTACPSYGMEHVSHT